MLATLDGGIESAGFAGAGALGAAGWLRAESLVRVLCRWKEPDLRDVVGVMGEPGSLMGEVGESRSLEPVESLVRFFLRNPRVGMGAASRGSEECAGRSASSRQCGADGRGQAIQQWGGAIDGADSSGSAGVASAREREVRGGWRCDVVEPARGEALHARRQRFTSIR